MPAVLGVALFVHQWTHGLDNIYTALYAIMMAIWATNFLEYIKRWQNTKAFEWGTLGMEEQVSSGSLIHPSFNSNLTLST